MKNLLLIVLTMTLFVTCSAQEHSEKTVSKNGMDVSWFYSKNLIHFEMSAPTDGWVTIGFNTHSGMEGAYLLMGHVVNGQANVVEYYTISPGNYKSLQALGELPQVSDVVGEEEASRTTLQFSLPIKAVCQYQKNLTKEASYMLIMAYSLEDDFQHHSTMRTSVDVRL